MYPNLLYQNYCIKCILIYCIKTIISKLLYQTIVSELLYQRILIIINDYNSSTLSFKRAGLLLLVLPLPQYLTTISPRRESDISAPIKVDLIFVTFYQSDEDPWPDQKKDKDKDKDKGKDTYIWRTP